MMRVDSDRTWHVVPLGSGAFLSVEFAIPSITDIHRPDSGVSARLDDDARAQAIEVCVRSLRASARRWGESRVPNIALNSSQAPNRNRVEKRIRVFLQALVNMQYAVNAVVAVRGKVVTSAMQLADEQRASLLFTQRRLQAEASRGQKSSHAELTGDDFYAVSFWYDACLIAFFSAPYAVDFVRHRARLVTREISLLLPLLDEPPPAGASAAPIPE
ncbi:MAG: hypothetical protein MJE77_32695 [Proteobacteria bacterium]|nr:hypothetical protein [Pseudomonadota bacterium]